MSIDDDLRGRVLSRLDAVLAARKQSGSSTSSYVAQLHHQGLNRILEKVGEECTETLLAAKDVAGGASDHATLVAETADLWFHCLVMLSHLELSSADVLAELEQRFDLSGLTEKARRPSTT